MSDHPEIIFVFCDDSRAARAANRQALQTVLGESFGPEFPHRVYMFDDGFGAERFILEKKGVGNII